MARTGRYLRLKLREDAVANTPERVAERKRRHETGEQIQREIADRFGPITTENAQSVVTFQARRFRELIDEGENR